MQGLEKILEEINQEKLKHWDPSERLEADKLIRWCFDKCTDIIRKHMADDPDGWVPVEERLPEKNEYFVDTSNDNDFPNGYYRRFEIAYMTDTIEYIHGYYDGYKWFNKWHAIINNVVSWKIHEPYSQERSENDIL